MKVWVLGFVDSVSVRQRNRTALFYQAENPPNRSFSPQLWENIAPVRFKLSKQAKQARPKLDL